MDSVDQATQFGGSVREEAGAEVDAAPRRGAALGNFIAVTGSTLLGGLLNALLIALAARRGEVAEIAAYTVMMAALAIVGVVLAGGSGMLYLSGTEAERHAVRSQRVLAVLPGLICTAVGVLLFYGGRGYSSAALIAAAAVFIGNSFAELPLAQLYRDQRFLRVAVPTLLSKSAAVVAFLLGAPLTTALLVGAAVYFAVLELLTAGRSPLRAMWIARPTVAAARSAFRSGRALYVYTIAELFTLRVPSIGVSLVAPLPVMGAFGAVASVYQALVSVFQSGLFVILTLRSRRHTAADQNRTGRRFDTEVLSLSAGLLCAVGTVVAAPWLVTDLLRLDVPEASTWLQVLGAAVPVFLLNRIIATHAIGDGRFTEAAKIALCLAALITISLVIAIPLFGVLGSVLAILVTEAVVAGALILRRLRPPIVARIS